MKFAEKTCLVPSFVGHTLRISLLSLLVIAVLSLTTQNLTSEQNITSGKETEDWLEIYNKSTAFLTSYTQSGNFNLGGLFDIYNVLNENCEDFNFEGLHWMYAMIYTIEEINKMDTLLNNITLGWHLYGLCPDANIAVETALDFVEGSLDESCDTLTGELAIDTATNSTDSAEIVALVGPATSVASISVASLLGLFNLPLISYSATSKSLSDPKYEYFLRTVPPDELQANAIADIINYYGWDTVIAMSSEDLAYGVDGLDQFKEEATSRNICIAYENRFSRSSSIEHFDKIISNIKKLENIKVIVLFAYEMDVLELFEQLYIDGSIEGHIFIASDAWALSDIVRKHSYVEKKIGGMFGIIAYVGKMDAGFENYVHSLSPRDQYKNPFYMEFWEEYFQCYFSINSPRKEKFDQLCTGYEDISINNSISDNFDMFKTAYDCVYVIAIALDEIINCQASNINGSCPDISDGIKGEDLLIHMKNATYNATNDQYLVSAIDELNPSGFYSIVNLQPTEDAHLEYKILGLWTSSEEQGSRYQGSNIVAWRINGSWTYSNISQVPVSFCSEDCQPGTRRSITDGACCWDCFECGESQFSVDVNSDSCSNCEMYQVSSKDRSSCEDLPVNYAEIGDIKKAVLFAFDIFGMLLLLIILLFFLSHKKSIVVLRNCIKNGFLPILIPLGLCFAATGAALFILPSDGFGCCFVQYLYFCPSTLLQCYLCWLVSEYYHYQSNSLKQIKQLTQSSSSLQTIDSVGGSREQLHEHAHKRSKLKPFAIILGSIFQIVIITLWTLLSPQKVEQTIVDNVVLVDCVEDFHLFSPILVPMIYIFVLDFIGLYISYHVRNIKLNQSEAKFLFFSFLSHFLVYIATVSTYFAFEDGVQIRPLVLSYGVTASCYVMLALLFSPKIHAIRLRKEESDNGSSMPTFEDLATGQNNSEMVATPRATPRATPTLSHSNSPTINKDNNSLERESKIISREKKDEITKLTKELQKIRLEKEEAEKLISEREKDVENLRKRNEGIIKTLQNSILIIKEKKKNVIESLSFVESTKL